MEQKIPDTISSNLIAIDNLTVSVEGKQVLHNLDLQIMPGMTYALIGPNGSGKSSLAYTLMGHPSYVVTQGSFYYKGSDLKSVAIDERARNGIFLALQSPIEIAGLSVYALLKEAVRARNVEGFSLASFTQHIEQMADIAHVARSWLHRHLDSGFSGGEKKKLELLQMLVLEPNFAILDEIDSGLDSDAITHTAKVLQLYCQQHSQASLLVISHQKSFLDLVQPVCLYSMQNGAIMHADHCSLLNAKEYSGYEVR
jgi:Fe-S cluster assembly ATP-binding protein